MKKLLFILFLFFSCYVAEASHMVSGYITYKCLGGTTYQITFYNYANTCNDAYDQDTLTMWFGDGTHQVVARSNGPIVDGFFEGEQVCTCRKLCIYQATHTYPGGNASYTFHIDDPARMANITNMIGSQNVNLYLYTTITLGAASGIAGDSIIAPIITNPLACVHACPGKCYFFNAGAYSPCGDSLSYSLGNCLAANGVIAPGYFIPSGATIDAKGTLSWCNPAPPGGGIYNFSIHIITYKKLAIGNRIEYAPVSEMEMELEVLVDSTCTNDPPTLTGPDDTCVEAGDLLKLKYSASGLLGNLIGLVATGPPFNAAPPATAPSPIANNPVSLQFTWNTNCTEVRKAPYPLLVTATTTNTNPPLNSYQVTNIYIVGPAPTHLTAVPTGNAIKLNWNPSPCPQATGYQIYRHIGCYKWIHGPCETGVPSYTGYTLIGTTVGLFNTTFTDNDGGRGLVPGLYYDYMVVATYPLPDGSLSYASNDTCLKLRRDVPILTNVSVDNTDASNGTIFVRWIKPLADASDLDTIANPGPYMYTLMRATGITGNSFSPVVTYTTAVFHNPLVDSTYKDAGLNTLIQGYNYRVDFYSNDNLVGSSPTASSIYLTVKPDNNMLHLSWQSHDPWSDSAYMVYRTFPAPVTFLAKVPGTQTTYTDSNLTNLKTFCYYVESKSFYADTSISHPLFDSSEVMCGEPKDTIPPCPPHLTVTPDCSIYHDSLVWDNPDYFCPGVKNRILYYQIFYSPTEGGELQLLATINNLKDTVYVRDTAYSIAGCFAVIAVDSFMNKSPLNTVCVDNCPQYVLPNIFTPNGDGKNDFFTPILPYRFIKNIDITIVNRWGQVMFHTLDPMIRWNGTDQASGKACPDGVYFYVCQVYEIRLNGIVPITLKGFIQILR